jgi:aryl-alcohol dehydrogenase-like predicted oxidoreductase
VQARSLGRSNLPVTPIGLGLAAIGRPGYINLGRDRDLGPNRDVETMRERAHVLLDSAYEAGVRYFDVARSYGLAEDFLGTWLDRRGFGAGVVTIGSKWGYRYTADWRVGAEINEIKDHSLANLRRQLGESRAILGARLQLYQIHSATQESGVLDDGTVLDELRRQADAGLAVGLTVSGPRQADTIRQAIAVRVGGRPLFATVQATWNLLETSAGAALEEAHEAGLGVIVKEALANGRLAARPGQSWPEPLVRMARARGATADAVAIAAVLANPWADVALSGAVTPAQLESNLAAVGLTLSSAELAELARLAERPADYWAARAALAWA